MIPAVACLAFAAPALAASTAAVSENWAGYEVSSSSGHGFSAVSGAWTQPAVKCTAGQATYSAFWVGLGGGDRSSSALEQQGTQADCSASGQASYYAWYELVPSAPVKIAMKVSPGDRIYSRTSVSGNQVTVEVDNRTTGQDFVRTLTMTNPAPDTSTAEWVAEAPSQCDSSTLTNCSVLPLSNFGTVKFTNAQATSGGHTGSISDSQWTATPISLSAGSSGLLGGDSGYPGSGYGSSYGSGYGSSYGYGGSGSSTAAPGSLSGDGTSFAVTYGAAGSAATSTAGGSSSSAGTGYPYSSSDPYGYGYGYSGDGYSSAYWYGYGGDYGGYSTGGLGSWYYGY